MASCSSSLRSSKFSGETFKTARYSLRGRMSMPSLVPSIAICCLLLVLLFDFTKPNMETSFSICFKTNTDGWVFDCRENLGGRECVYFDMIVSRLFKFLGGLAF